MTKTANNLAEEVGSSFSFTEWMTTHRHEGTIIWLFNIGAEEVWHAQPTGVADPAENRIVNRMEDMVWLLSREQDVLIMRAEPSRLWQDYMRSLGFPGPRVLFPSGAAEDEDTPISELVLRDAALLERLSRIGTAANDTVFVPYAVTNREQMIAAASGLRLIGGPAEASAVINDKVHSRELAARLGLRVTSGRICSSADEMMEAYYALRFEGYRKVVLKQPYNASGKGMFVADSEDRFSAWVRRMERMAKRSGETRWLVEGWLEPREDWNAQLWIGPSGETELFSVTRQLVNGTVYNGSEFATAADEAELVGYHSSILRVGQELARLGYVGVAGIDSIRTEFGGWIPVVEINGRFTLSTYISFLSYRFPNRFLRTRYRRLPADGTPGFDELLDLLRREHLLYERETGEGIIVYVSGTLPPAATTRAPGRLFTISVASTRERALGLENRLEAVLACFRNEAISCTSSYDPEC
ncbi:peptide ligase PGM1-related protein [Paenibacillus prosopidis]|uniref:ATP-grasp domain-containing protein n=1 Tax=Paenibacillus prosopidis TaxID=630520 RepID=A0A368VVN6_9BACL|nr:peptide ligase PGM1-related protein [Paenibacillus prosopidis]RCW43493.1 hypothetical protein DFP97_113166 [Paenibacillus prosopidis]